MITAVSCENIQSVSGGPAILQKDPKVKLHRYDKKIPIPGVEHLWRYGKKFPRIKINVIINSCVCVVYSA